MPPAAGDPGTLGSLRLLPAHEREPGSADPSAARAHFAADAGLALAGSLNLRRCAGQILALAVPRLGSWAELGISAGEAGRWAATDDAGRPVVGPSFEVADAARPVPAIDGPRVLQPAPADAVAPAEVPLAVVAGSGSGRELPLEPAGRVFAGVPWLVEVPFYAHGELCGVLRIAGEGPLGEGEDGVLSLAVELARRAAPALAAARVYEERGHLASTLRSALLPPPLPEGTGAVLGARYRPAQEATQIGGDFYDAFRDAEGRWWFAIGDVCGKGVDAAVLTGQVRQALRVAAFTHESPADVLGVLNTVMLHTDGTNYVTVLTGRLAPSPEGVELIVASGGHPRPLLLRGPGAVEEAAVSGTLVGMLPWATFGQARLYLEPGQTCLLYTDGVIEAAGAGRDRFGVTRLERVLADSWDVPAAAVAERIEQEVLEHLDGRPHDDIAILAIQAPREHLVTATAGGPQR